MHDFQQGEGLRGQQERGESLAEDLGEIFGRDMGWEEGCRVDDTGAPGEEIESVVGEEVGFC